MLKKWVLLGMFVSIGVYAQDDQVIVDGAIGVFHSGEKSLSETKLATFGIQEDLLGPWKDRAVVGGWLDNAGNGKTGSALISGQLGFEINSNGTIGSIFAGPCLISHPDEVLLGGYLEFMEDFHLGLQDHGNNYIGVFYRHISDAGLTSVNIGRDVVGIELRW